MGIELISVYVSFAINNKMRDPPRTEPFRATSSDRVQNQNGEIEPISAQYGTKKFIRFQPRLEQWSR